MRQLIVIALASSLILSCPACVSAEKHHAMDLQMAAASDTQDALARAAAEAAAYRGQISELREVAEKPANPVAPPAVEKAAQPAAAVQRVIIYSGLLHLVVSDIATTLDAVRAQAQSMGGYLQEQDASSITVRIPAAKFQDAVAAFSRLGVLTQKQIKAQDVTEEMRDLRIRLDNATQTRQRLLAHLEKSTKTEDTIKIEAELERVTQTIELIKGKLQAMETNVAFSVLKVQLNSPRPQQQAVNQVPFAWVRQLGEAVITGATTPNADTSRRERREIRFEPPPSYIRFYDRDEVSESMSADGVVLRIQKQKNFPGGDVAFWSTLARRTLVENRAVAFDRETDFTSRDKTQGKLMAGSRDLAGQKSGYLLALFVTEDHVYAAEAWGPQGAFEKDREALVKAVGTIEARR